MLNLFIPGSAGNAAILENKVLVKLSANVFLTNFPRPSVVFKNTFPVNPSVTIASTLPENASLPSTFPIKLILSSSDFSFNNLYLI